MARDNNENAGMNQQFNYEEVGRMIGSAVAAAMNYERDNYNGELDEDGLKRKKDGSVDRRQFNNGQGRTNNNDNDDE